MIKNIQPDYIILHTGCVFLQYPKELLSIFTHIKERYPNIKLGYQKMSYLDQYEYNLEKSGIFDLSDEMAKFEEMTFRL